MSHFTNDPDPLGHTPAERSDEPEAPACPDCGGSGVTYDFDTCPSCNGTGGVGILQGEQR